MSLEKFWQGLRIVRGRQIALESKGEPMSALLKSKKFKVLIAAVLIAAASGITGTQEWGTAVQQIVAALLVYIGAQGVADFGKGAAEVKNGG